MFNYVKNLWFLFLYDFTQIPNGRLYKLFYEFKYKTVHS